MRRFCTILFKGVAALVLCALITVAVLSLSPIYDFEKGHPFEGPDIFNPYASLDTTAGWKRANFHTHTKVDGLFNECPMWPGEVYEKYRQFGYEILTFSNHNSLTRHPVDPALQVNVYEHGFNPLKFHLLVFGSEKVHYYDLLLPYLPSQKQWLIDFLGRDSDFIQMNHPFCTRGTTREGISKLTGYRIMELDSGVTTQQEYWDWALSAGHYSFGLTSDDLHKPDVSYCFACHCDWLNCPSAGYEDIRNTLLGGCYYAMRVPDYGWGNWETKLKRNRSLPQIDDIGVRGDTVYIRLNRNARHIVANGQNHSVLVEVSDTNAISYVMNPEDSYIRFTAEYPHGLFIYTNPFARYDKTTAASPYVETPHPVNILLTVLFNLALLLICAGLVFCLIRLFSHVEKKS